MIPTRQPLSRRAAFALLAAPALVPGTARAQAWPARPLRVIVPFAPGGATDLIARLVADNLAGPLGQQVVVENRAGAFGIIGADAVAKAAPDGHTLLAGSPGPMAVNPYVYRTLPYDPERDLVGVSLVATIPYVMVVPATLPVSSVQEFVALARARPGSMNFATSGMASRLTVEMFRALAGGLELEMVQYRGGAPARTDLLAGRIQLVIEQAPSFLEDFRSGRLRALAVGTTRRFALLPDVPTMQEAGVPGYEASAWLGYAAPAGTPMEVRRRLATEIDRILAMPAIRERLLSWGAEPVGGTPEDMDRMLVADRHRWSEAVRLAGIEKE
ncbi:Bug family tripartite tricarboxylate transporter substrate binding protein [Plastoroseomonas hellenica]|uniref:Tripartite tricarboxylate transporter substrate binding protein n=1 Tax=Plastoroseomonas hellenica TaxID=2687306 RepID=A0ABS5F5L0_9PROT|nr:tripartite tricarboxylate transporter substrate binding protein [Plastoroseomonas hellenica]MBR0645908.1 tripartite tricarboxylate transporter substrate binding protein [Plastoroseomonas hellenica]MBR0667817.1 tripartite tricarboxylate transporter substrate binding protein [Plastoroseomonas hellenica]